MCTRAKLGPCRRNVDQQSVPACRSQTLQDLFDSTVSTYLMGSCPPATPRSAFTGLDALTAKSSHASTSGPACCSCCKDAPDGSTTLHVSCKWRWFSICKGFLHSVASRYSHLVETQYSGLPANNTLDKVKPSLSLINRRWVDNAGHFILQRNSRPRQVDDHEVNLSLSIAMCHMRVMRKRKQRAGQDAFSSTMLTARPVCSCCCCVPQGYAFQMEIMVKACQKGCSVGEVCLSPAM